MNGQAENQKPSTSVRSVKVRTGIKREKLTQNRLKDVLDYNPDTGVFIWKVNHHRIKKGCVAGNLTAKGYIEIKVDGIIYGAHRLAFLYMEGFFPEYDVDHKNGIRCDNRWSEILHITHMCNMQNQKKRTTNKSGFPGVSYDHNERRWRADIRVNGKSIRLGRYPLALEAALARFTAEHQCDEWKCNHRSELAKAIKAAWPGFKTEVA